jgi:hypothetical protein
VTLSNNEALSTFGARPATVLVKIDLEPPRQNRWSVFFRGVLCIPLAFVLVLLGIGVEVIVILAWFAALVTGHVPDGFHRFLTKYERFSANLFAYEYLLVAKWPGVEYPRPGEQVSVEILNVKQSRVSIFFRALLSIPAGIVGTFWNLGHALIVFVMWVWILIRGKAPKSLHVYGALWLRYNIRLSSYTLLLTPEQPWHGMRGDGIAASSGSETTSTLENLTEVHADVLVADDAAPIAALASDDLLAPVSTGYQWSVPIGARRLVNWSIPLGALLFVAYLVLLIALTAGRFSVADQVTRSYSTTYNVERVFAPAVTKCPTISCINAASKVAMAGEVRADASLTGNFSRASSQFEAYGDDLDTLISEYDLMSRETTIPAIRSTLISWQSTTEKTQKDANALFAALT